MPDAVPTRRSIAHSRGAEPHRARRTAPGSQNRTGRAEPHRASGTAPGAQTGPVTLHKRAVNPSATASCRKQLHCGRVPDYRPGERGLKLNGSRSTLLSERGSAVWCVISLVLGNKLKADIFFLHLRLLCKAL